MASESKLRALLAMEQYNILLLSSTSKLLQAKKKRKHRCWVHDIFQKRSEHGVHNHLVRELELDEDRFHQYFRMTREQFDQLLPYMEGKADCVKSYFGSPLSVCCQLDAPIVPYSDPNKGERGRKRQRKTERERQQNREREKDKEIEKYSASVPLSKTV